jgi:hypothetical protein
VCAHAAANAATTPTAMALNAGDLPTTKLGELGSVVAGGGHARRTGRGKRHPGTEGRPVKRTLFVALTAAAVAAGGFALGTGAAQADTIGPDGLYHWCPGSPMPTSEIRATDGTMTAGPPNLQWDMSVCHAYYRHTVQNDDGTQTFNIVEADPGDPPPPPPPCYGFVWCD